MENCLSNARLLSQSLEATEWYECLSDIHRPEGVHSLKAADPRKEVGFKEGETSAQYNAGLPVVAFCFSELVRKEYPHAEQEKVSQLMRAKGWIIPNYALPPAEDHQEILRVVVRESMSFDLLDRLIADLCSVTENILKNEEPDFSRVHRSNNIEAVHSRAEKERREGEQEAKEGKGKEQEADKLDKKAESVSAKGKKKGKGKSRMPGAIHSSVC
jgi:glutamate decarboxylase